MSLVSPLHKLACFQEEIQFEVLGRLNQTPQVSQLALGLGAINFCFQAWFEKGLVKMQNFSQNKNKFRYAYLLTLAEVAEKSKLTAEFLKSTAVEYKALQAEIETLKVEINSAKVDIR